MSDDTQQQPNQQDSKMAWISVISAFSELLKLPPLVVVIFLLATPVLAVSAMSFYLTYSLSENNRMLTANIAALTAAQIDTKASTVTANAVIVEKLNLIIANQKEQNK